MKGLKSSMDPMTLIMLALIGLLIIMMVRNGRKRREQVSQMQQGLVPGAEIMLQTGIYGTFVRFDDEDENRAYIQTGDSTILVHRNAIGQIVTPVAVADEPIEPTLAPDDDPAFGESTNPDDRPESPDNPSSDNK